jgi:hypothetical protein
MLFVRQMLIAGCVRFVGCLPSLRLPPNGADRTGRHPKVTARCEEVSSAEGPQKFAVSAKSALAAQSETLDE